MEFASDYPAGAGIEVLLFVAVGLLGCLGRALFDAAWGWLRRGRR